jgi:hypothetical protein
MTSSSFTVGLLIQDFTKESEDLDEFAALESDSRSEALAKFSAGIFVFEQF